MWKSRAYGVRGMMQVIVQNVAASSQVPEGWSQSQAAITAIEL